MWLEEEIAGRGVRGRERVGKKKKKKRKKK
jgi:hypothetical protein